VILVKRLPDFSDRDRGGPFAWKAINACTNGGESDAGYPEFIRKLE